MQAVHASRGQFANTSSRSSGYSLGPSVRECHQKGCAEVAVADRDKIRLEPSMLLLLYIAVRLAAFVLIFVCLGLALRRARSYERVSSFPLFLWAVVFVALSAFLAVL